MKNILKKFEELANTGKFKEIERRAGLPKGSAGKLKNAYNEVKRELRRAAREARNTPAAIEERRARTRLLEHARYCRKKASGKLVGVNPTGPTRMTRCGGKSGAEIRSDKVADKAAKKAALERKKALTKDTNKVYKRELKRTDEYRKMNSAYMRWYCKPTAERLAEFEEAKKEYSQHEGDHMLMRIKIKEKLKEKLNGGE